MSLQRLIFSSIKNAYERLKIMSRHSITASPSIGLWASVENTVRLTLKTLSAPSADAASLEMLEGEQARIRRTGRHWLIG